MTKYLLSISLLVLLAACSESATTNSDTSESGTSTPSNNETQLDSINNLEVVDTIHQDTVADLEIPEAITQLNNEEYSNIFITEYAGKAIFYSSEIEVFLRDEKTLEEILLSPEELNGKSVNVIHSYLLTHSDNEYGCCDAWSEEEFCSYFSLVEIEGKRGYLDGSYVYLLSESTYDEILLEDVTNQVNYSFLRARNIRSCSSEILLISKNESTPALINLWETDYYGSDIFQLFGEWTVLEKPFMRGEYPVIRVTDGVDGNYSFSFFEITNEDGEYFADNYFETQIMVSYDEFAEGYDFDKDLHEQYQEELGEDF